MRHVIKREDVDGRVVVVALATTIITLTVAARIFTMCRRSKKDAKRCCENVPTGYEDFDWEESEDEKN